MTDDDADDEQSTREITKESQRPVHEHFPDGDAAVDSTEGGVHEGTSGQIRARQDNDDETEGEDEGAKHLDHAWSVLLVPWRCVDGHVAGTGKGQEGTGHEGRNDDLVYPHVRLGCAGSRAYLDGFFGCVGIVDDLQGSSLVGVLRHLGRVALLVQDTR